MNGAVHLALLALLAVSTNAAPISLDWPNDDGNVTDFDFGTTPIPTTRGPFDGNSTFNRSSDAPATPSRAPTTLPTTRMETLGTTTPATTTVEAGWNLPEWPPRVNYPYSIGNAEFQIAEGLRCRLRDSLHSRNPFFALEQLIHEQLQFWRRCDQSQLDATGIVNLIYNLGFRNIRWFDAEIFPEYSKVGIEFFGYGWNRRMYFYLRQDDRGIWKIVAGDEFCYGWK